MWNVSQMIFQIVLVLSLVMYKTGCLHIPYARYSTSLTSLKDLENNGLYSNNPIFIEDSKLVNQKKLLQEVCHFLFNGTNPTYIWN